MTRRGEVPVGDVLLAGVIAIVVQVATLSVLRISGGAPLKSPSDEPQPMVVAINPVLDAPRLPALKLGSKPQPNKLPDMVDTPRPVERALATATPSTKADPTPQAIPTTKVSDAGAPPPDAEVAKEVDNPVPPSDDPRPPAVSNTEGAPDGVRGGTETDPLKAHAVSLYRAQLDSWFSSRFRIRGQIPFETLKTLRASVVVNVSSSRTVDSFRIVSPSGDEIFDSKLRASLEAIQSSGAELPPPPPMYPDILGQTLSLSFSCTNRRLCE